MTRPLILATGSLAVIAAVLAVIWTMQRGLMYFPMGDACAGEIVPTVSIVDLRDERRVSGGWFVALRPSPRSRSVFNGNAATIAPGGPWRRVRATDYRFFSSIIGYAACGLRQRTARTDSRAAEPTWPPPRT